MADESLKAAFNDLLQDCQAEAHHWPADRIEKFRRYATDLTPSAAMKRPSNGGRRSGEARADKRKEIVAALAAAWTAEGQEWFSNLPWLERKARLPAGCCRRRKITKSEIEAAARAL